MRRFVFHALGIAGAFLASLAVYQAAFGSSAHLVASAAETVTGVGAMWFALAVLG